MNQKLTKFGIEIPAITSEEIDDAIKPVLKKMEKNGIKIDIDALKKLDIKLSKRVAELEIKIQKMAGHDFNVSSPIQMADVLFKDLKLPTQDLKKTKAGISTAAGELRKIEKTHPIIPLILEHRELAKLISTYLKPLPTLVDEENRLHTTYGLDTSTGRLNSSEPNLQNIPIKGKYGTEIRTAFVASKGNKLICADYSQIELRIVACLANDPAMIKSFEKGEDIHRRTASEILEIPLEKVTPEQRQIAKAVNFGIVYGQTPYGLSQSLAIETQKAAEYIIHYFNVHKGIKQYINDMIEKAHTDGFVETLFGRKRYLPNINSRMRYIAEGEERMAINTPVQGTAAEILKLAMIDLDNKLTKASKQAKMLLSVHDEIVIEGPTADAKKIAQMLKESMAGVVKLCIPIEINVGIGNNWAEAK
jgi:DNA polymerase I